MKTKASKILFIIIILLNVVTIFPQEYSSFDDIGINIKDEATHRKKILKNENNIIVRKIDSLSKFREISEEALYSSLEDIAMNRIDSNIIWNIDPSNLTAFSQLIKKYSDYGPGKSFNKIETTQDLMKAYLSVSSYSMKQVSYYQKNLENINYSIKEFEKEKQDNQLKILKASEDEKKSLQFKLSGNLSFDLIGKDDGSSVTPQINANWKWAKGDKYFYQFELNSSLKFSANTNDSNAALFHVYKTGSDFNGEILGKVGWKTIDTTWAVILGGSLKGNYLFERKFSNKVSNSFLYASLTAIIGIKADILVLAFQLDKNFVKGDGKNFMKDNLANSYSLNAYLGIKYKEFQAQIKYLLGSDKGVVDTDVPEIKFGISYSLL